MRRPSVIILWSFIVTLIVWGALIAATPEGSMRGTMMGHMGWGGGFPWLRAKLVGPLDEADVRRMMEAWLRQERNPRLQLGPIIAKDDNTFQADIVTKDSSLVQRFAINRRTGAIWAVED